MPEGFSNGLKKSTKSEKNKLDTMSTKHVENKLNLTSLELQETRFRIEWLSKITETGGAGKHTTIQKHVQRQLCINKV